MTRLFSNLIFASIFALLVGVSISAAHAERRLALIVGNDAYQTLPKLDKAVADAESYAEVLRADGFDLVILKTDLTRGGMDLAIAVFLDAIQPGDTAVFIYAGHGWSDGSQNYILGTDTPRVGSDDLLSRVSIPLKNGVTGVLDDMDRKGAGLKVAIIDACRDNPFRPDANGRGVGASRGLTRIDPPKGTFVVFSAGTGQTALDSLSEGDTNPNSVFTRVFAPLLASGLTLRDATIKARAEVVSLADQAHHDQLPAYYDEALGMTCLSKSCTGEATITGKVIELEQPSPPKPVATDRERLLWDAIKDSDHIDDFQTYLKTYPHGVYAPLAKSRIAALPPPQQLKSPQQKTLSIVNDPSNKKVDQYCTAAQAAELRREILRARSAGDYSAGPIIIPQFKRQCGRNLF